MTQIRIEVSTVDGGAMTLRRPVSWMRQLAALERQGYTGKRLINAAISDDRGPPPRMITITGTDENGKRINRTIGYD